MDYNTEKEIMSQVHHLPTHVDEPPIILIWSADEIGAFFFFFIIGFLLQQILIFAAIGYAALRYMRRFRNAKARGHAIHMMYWFGVSLADARTLPNPYQKHFLR